MYRQMYNHYIHEQYPNVPMPSSMVPHFGYNSIPMMQRNNMLQRAQVFPYGSTVPFSDYSPLPEMNPHYYPVTNGFQQEMYYPQNEGTLMHHVFQNPLNPSEQHAVHSQQQLAPNAIPYMNPYPKGSHLTKQPSGMKNVLNSFKTQDGSLDINKMVDTAGQMINAVNQVSSVVKGFGGMFKG